MRVQKGFAIRCMRPATYIFLRNPEFDSLYDVPVSILDVNLNDSTITVGIRVLSAKTKSLASAEDKILVRGPYRSGFIGREFRKMDGTVDSLQRRGSVSRNICLQSSASFGKSTADGARCTFRAKTGAAFPAAGRSAVFRKRWQNCERHGASDGGRQRFFPRFRQRGRSRKNPPRHSAGEAEVYSAAGQPELFIGDV